MIRINHPKFIPLLVKNTMEETNLMGDNLYKEINKLYPLVKLKRQEFKDALDVINCAEISEEEMNLQKALYY